jgi:hypothetical protein
MAHVNIRPKGPISCGTLHPIDSRPSRRPNGRECMKCISYNLHYDISTTPNGFGQHLGCILSHDRHVLLRNNTL